MTKLNVPEKIVIGTIGIFLLVSRLAYSSFTTPSLTHDETIYAANAHSLANTGRDLTGRVSYFSLKPIHHMYAEYPASLMSLFFRLFDNPIVATHAFSILISITLPFVIAWIMHSLFKNRKLSLISIAVIALSPLNWQFSHLAYDSYFSLFFYLLGTAVYLYYPGKKLIWSIPLFFIGFFNYQGYKLLLFPLTICLYLYKTNTSNRSSQNHSTMLLPLFALILSLFYGLILLPKQDSFSRLSQTIFSDEAIKSQITHQKTILSLAPNLGRIFANKYSSISFLAFDHLFASFNPGMMFMFGEPSASGFAVWSHGFFYLIDLPLILYGLFMLASHKKYRPQALLVAGFFFIGLIPPITSTISNWYLLRTLFSYFVLLLPISLALFHSLKHPRLFVILAIIYALSSVNFAYQYYFRYPLYRSDQAELHERIAVEYAMRVGEDQKIIVYDDEPHYLYQTHLLFGKEYNQDIKIDSYNQTVYRIKNVTYTNECQSESNGEVVMVSNIFDPCKEHIASVSAQIKSPIDSGTKYFIHNDQLCRNQTLERYIRISHLNQLSFTNISNDEFCARWINE